VIADTAVRRSLAGSAYNERRAACEQAVKRLQEFLPGIRALRDVSPLEFERFAGQLPEVISRRARHVVEEIERTRRAVTYLACGDLAGFGSLLDRCHASLRDLFEVSCPELDAMVEIARSLPGCLGARLTGAGFGGCTVNLVTPGQAADFADVLASQYRRRTGLEAQISICQAADGAGVQEVE
jgi:galactokinase